jgi:hypothetical protein
LPAIGKTAFQINGGLRKHLMCLVTTKIILTTVASEVSLSFFLSFNVVYLSLSMCIVVDKMASYVARNGRSFEEVVRSKGENRIGP